MALVIRVFHSGDYRLLAPNLVREFRLCKPSFGAGIVNLFRDVGLK